MVVTEFVQPSAVYHSHKWHFCGVLGVSGVVAFGIGAVLNQPRGQIDHASGVEHEPKFLLFDLSFWGMVFAFCGSSMTFIVPSHSGVAARASTVSTNAAPKKPDVRTN